MMMMMMIMCNVFISICFFLLKVITRLAGMEEVKSLTVIFPLKKKKKKFSVPAYDTRLFCCRSSAKEGISLVKNVCWNRGCRSGVI